MSGTNTDSATLAYGLTAGGFVRMRLPEIRRSIFDSLNLATGETWDETPNSFMGQLVNVFADREAALWELLEAVYLSAFPVSATGQSLDMAVSYSGVRRLQDTPSRASVILFGVQGTIVPQGSLIESTYLPPGLTRNPQFRLVAGVAITRDDLAYLELAIPATVTAGRTYTIRFNGTDYIASAGAADTADSIARMLAGSLLFAGASAVATGANITITGPAPFIASWSDTVSLVTMGTPGLADCTTGGPIPAPAGSLSRIVNPVGGWNAVSNTAPATLGTVREDDTGLRSRYESGVFRLGAGVLPSIDANIRNDIPGILFAKTYENNTSTTDADGRPGHSIELIADGGDTNAIALRLFALKGAGIESYGNTSAVIRDIDGYQHIIKFTRPDPVKVWLRIQRVADPEQSMPGDVDDRIKAAVMLWAEGGTLADPVNGSRIIPRGAIVGRDVQLQRIAAMILDSVPGLARVNITQATRAATNNTTPALGEYSTADAAMSIRQRASFDPLRITVYA